MYKGEYPAVALWHVVPAVPPQYHSAYLTSGCFSPTRAGVFFVTRMDGVVDIWDYFYRQNEVAYSHKVGTCFFLIKNKRYVVKMSSSGLAGTLKTRLPPYAKSNVFPPLLSFTEESLQQGRLQ